MQFSLAPIGGLVADMGEQTCRLNGVSAARASDVTPPLALLAYFLTPQSVDKHIV